MMNFALGALAMACLYTFAPPKVAAWPSEVLRKAWAWLRSKAEKEGLS